MQASTARSGLVAVAVACLALLPASALAEETICAPEFYFNSTEQPAVIIAIDAARAAGSRVTRIDIETGAYRQHFVGDEAGTLESGTMQIVNAGSLRERIDFVALDVESGLLLRISLVDEGMPFVRVDGEGLVASGHCVHEYDQ
jgi:hypothetical protein